MSNNQATVCGKTVLLPDMNDLQAVFNYVILHLRRQKVRSDGNGECLYRGRHNTSCAVGCLIPDSRYTESMEGDAPTTERLCKCLGLEPDDPEFPAYDKKCIVIWP